MPGYPSSVWPVREQRKKGIWAMRQDSVAGRQDVCVTILLSTYNGAAFLSAQLESFLAQTHQNWVLYWRDDGSSDETVEMMQAFAAHVGAQRCVMSPSSGGHKGLVASFLTLLREQGEASFVAFSDQDDVWFPGKLDAAVSALCGANAEPALYCARQYLVDSLLGNPRLSIGYKSVPEFPGCLAYNLANGNSIVMNQAAAALVARAKEPEGTVHDWWSYIVVSACGGKIIFDPQPQLFYRMHRANVIGRAQPFMQRARAALQRGSLIYMTVMRRHLEALKHSSLPLTREANQAVVLLLAGMQKNPIKRLAALRCKHFHRSTKLENLLFRYWFLTNRSVERDYSQAPLLALHRDVEGKVSQSSR